ncbi:MAG TPA: hypothetical protein VHQ00_10860, partial [Chloroflexota bacterium]|nr:hypothetical protein [Chloroflexota bacterium]
MVDDDHLSCFSGGFGLLRVALGKVPAPAPNAALAVHGDLGFHVLGERKRQAVEIPLRRLPLVT